MDLFYLNVSHCAKVMAFYYHNLSLLSTGRVPPVHRGPAASREGLLLHLVQPAGRQAQVLQEAREADEPGGGAPLQGGAAGGLGKSRERGKMCLKQQERSGREALLLGLGLLAR